ncbi:Lcl domain-containing protein [Treponema sp. R80B11-R83G3]
MDDAIRTVARNIESNVEQGEKIALLNFNSPSEQFSEYVLEELSSQLVRGKRLIVLDRKELDLIRKEEQFQMSGEVSDESAQAIGRKLGAQVIASGSLSAVGNAYRFRVKVLAVESAAIVAAPSVEIRADEKKVVFLLGEKEVSQANAGSGQTSAKASSASISYKIGARGPGGGIVFYDKGTFSDGWQYLEAAPAETEFSAQWRSKWDYTDWGYLKDEIGFGKKNTEYIVQNINDSQAAAQLCAKMNFNGFKDWFLPSVKELDLIYKNLKEKGLGSFSDKWYWSLSVDDKGYRMQYLRFNDGRQSSSEVTNSLSVRAIRAF